VILTLHEIEPFRRGWRFDRRHLDQRLSSLGDDERLTLGPGLNEPREVSLSLVNIEGFHELAIDLVH
jgi:hypothetical protein